MIPKEVFVETIAAFFEPIRPWLEDPTVADIMINGPDEIYIERKGVLELTGARFDSRESLETALHNAAQYSGKVIDAQRPILEGRLPDGSRIEAIFPPTAPHGPSVAIRRFSHETLTVDRLIGLGAMVPDAARLLHAIVAARLNIVVAGGTGSGKTSMLNALSSFIPESERVVTIEDARELQLQQRHVVSLEASPPDPKGRGAITVRDLFRATLRLRPDRIVVGEIRGGEALDMIQAMTSGHGGCMATLHATYPADTLTRLETMAMMSDVQMPLSALRVQLASAVNFIIQTARLPDGSRKISHVTEVREFDAVSQRYIVEDIFVLRSESTPGAPSAAQMIATGTVPRTEQILRAHGFELPDCIYRAARDARPSAAE